MAKKRRSNSTTNAAQANDTPGNPSLQPQQNLPSKRVGKATKRTSAPLYKTPLNNFIYALTALSICFIAFYSYKITAWKTQAGGWWNLATGHRPSPPPGTGETSKGGPGAGGDVEAKISDLASAFGIPPATLATAIASAVSAHAPRASLSSISENEAPTASVVQSLVRDKAAEASASANGFFGKLSNVVGFDDAGAELD